MLVSSNATEWAQAINAVEALNGKSIMKAWRALRKPFWRPEAYDLPGKAPSSGVLAWSRGRCRGAPTRVLCAYRRSLSAAASVWHLVGPKSILILPNLTAIAIILTVLVVNTDNYNSSSFGAPKACPLISRS